MSGGQNIASGLFTPYVAVIVMSEPTALCSAAGNWVAVVLQVLSGLHVVVPLSSFIFTITLLVSRAIACVEKNVATLPTVMVQVLPFAAHVAPCTLTYRAVISDA